MAWTIEFDNAFEQRMQATWARPFLVSATMWGNVMRHVPVAGIDLGHLSRRSGLRERSLTSILGGLERWGYVTVDHDPAQGHPGRRNGFGTARGLTATTILRPSNVGELATGIWRPLAEEIDERWRRRGKEDVDRLEEALAPGVEAVADHLPAFLPVLNSAGLFSEPVLAGGPSDARGCLGLSTTLSRALLALTIDIERNAELSLPVSVIVLRLLGADPTPVRDLPLLTGVSKEAISLVLGVLENQAAVSVESQPTGRGKVARIAPRGAELRQEVRARTVEVERAWAERCGGVDAVEAAVDALHDDTFLRPALEPAATGWRSQKPYAARTAAYVGSPAAALPHHPIVLHRGGWPDGS